MNRINKNEIRNIQVLLTMTKSEKNMLELQAKQARKSNTSHVVDLLKKVK